MPVEIFCCYAHEDKALLRQLKVRLKPLQRQRLIEVWHDCDVSAGSEWEHEIGKHLNEAQIILLLISPDFMASDYCYSVEMKRALERHDNGEARVIPIILRPVNWKNTPLSRLQALPNEKKPITTWRNRDTAFVNILEGINYAIENMSISSLYRPSTISFLQSSINDPQNQPYLNSLKDDGKEVNYPIQPGTLQSDPLQVKIQPLHLKIKPKSLKLNTIFALIVTFSIIISSIVVGLLRFESINIISMPFPLPIPLRPTPTSIPPAFVQGSFNASSGNTNTMSLSVTHGDLLIVAVTQYERTLLGSTPVTDDRGDRYQKAGNLIANPSQQQDYAELYYVLSAKGGLTTVTVSFNPPPDTDGGDTSLGLYEYRGLGSLDSALATTSKDVNGNILTVSSKLNTTAASEMCFALGIDSGPQKQGEKNNITVTKGKGYVLRYPTGNQTTDAANDERLYTEDAFVAPGGCIPNFTIAYPSFWGIIGAAFKP